MMKYTHKNTQWFTLIELLVSITIFSIIMVSVITIFIFSANLSGKVDINRVMQENIKNAVETIAEDVRKNGIGWVSNTNTDWNCTAGSLSGNKLCISDGLDWYTLKKIDAFGNLVRVNGPDMSAQCSDIQTHCVLYKWDSPLTNSFVSFRELNFSISWDDDNQKKVTINFVLQPAIKKWVRSDLIKNSKLVFQTTISERLIQSN